MPRPARTPKVQETRLGPKNYAKLKEKRLKNLGAGDTELLLDFLPAEEAEEILKALVPMEEGSITSPTDGLCWQRMDYYGLPVPRLVCIQGEATEDGSMPLYRHPVDVQPPIATFTPAVQRVVAAARKRFGFPFNHALIQLYRSGEDSISVHTDKTLDIAHGTPIVNVSYGASRSFLLLSKAKSKCGSGAEVRQHLTLLHNSALSLGLETNRLFTHQIAPDRRAEGQRRSDETAFGGTRVSLTLRVVATFRCDDGIYGQGARCKTRAQLNRAKGPQEDKEDEVEALRMAEAFRRENVEADFDWKTHYGAGFDIITPNYVQQKPTLTLEANQVRRDENTGSEKAFSSATVK